eukprot:4043346-Pyramimonas_sp.AAC.2
MQGGASAQKRDEVQKRHPRPHFHFLENADAGDCRVVVLVAMGRASPFEANLAVVGAPAFLQHRGGVAHGALLHDIDQAVVRKDAHGPRLH